jgi:predicted amidohydrolase
MRIALLQLDQAWEDVEENHRRAALRLDDAAQNGARLAILPEMFPTGFSMDSARIAQAPGGPTEMWLRGKAHALRLWILAGVAESGEDGQLPKNNALLVSPDDEVFRYTKLHPFSMSGEDRFYSSGTSVRTFNLHGVRITPLICYDLRFPEPFRLATDDTDAYIVIANWPERRRAHWRALLKARAIENLAYVVGVNRVGDADGLHYSGDSAVISPYGETIVSAAENPTVLMADIDPRLVIEAREKFPFLKDRRPTYVR